MRNYLNLTMLACCGVVTFSACNQHIYVPNTVNEPLLKEKHEFKGSVSPSNYQAAFALTNNIAVMANGQYVYDFLDASDNEGSDVIVDSDTRGGVIEGAIGYFKPLDPKKRMVFDVYAGYGRGSFKTLADAYQSSTERVVNDYLLRTHFNKYFIQPGIGLSHPVIEAAFTSRISLLKFNSLYAGPKAFENDTARRVNYMSIGNKVLPLYEPAFTFRVGYKYVKFQMQLLFSLLINDERYGGYDIDDYFQPVALNMGVSVNIAHWYDDFKKKR
ncbi:hypothetical protein [Chitinophaga filiformis]|uniref:Outer membrane protein beta-barrel domain-containing protein n=1 Tax=Chitinophaga filiformis TaxID=104663 RepID=A0A1G7XD45_CHIFI|nr:hypothetical protein [Chitinophaga filiformis]SDG82034.1 hypothetical protein SAMN04488121_106399 [Chitinophaga filiformis]